MFSSSSSCFCPLSFASVGEEVGSGGGKATVNWTMRVVQEVAMRSY